MTVRQGGAAPEAVDVSGEGAVDGGTTGQPAPPMLRVERLDYIAEIVLELEAMAGQVGCPTLAGLLGLAYREAKLRRRD